MTIRQIMAVFPRHEAIVDAFKARGEVIGIGPFADLGNMRIFWGVYSPNTVTLRPRTHPGLSGGKPETVRTGGVS
jgi:hypothetical protein